MKKLLMILAFLIIITGCDEKANSPDSNEVKQLETEVQDLKDKVQEAEKELEKLRDIERLYEYQVQDTSYINMYSSQFLYNLQSEGIDNLNERSHEELHFKEKNDEIYAITPSYEKKITYNNDNQTLERWFIESVSFEQSGNAAEATIRPLYFDENNVSVKEDRYFTFYFVKIKDDWLLQDISF
ncbi:hypothetical protein [Aquisalibacillus elongatus]|uniref:Lipoprotein n=1 Tax=Aquisalibacillus elongatus TaxID=485577 RepID=A0A3N5CFL0_9BACI|nr:hypothetical protein [Aquisalibacillus elongatus]RPF56131.1 hypothetical protein EDC24_1020 [Aquisalibacillus elongatus]